MALEEIKNWFLANRREFPWRENPSPYEVWVSEVMLQQTRASVVVPYFLRWLTRFPTLEALSEAQEDEVIKLWEGLGYYSRARNLLAGAKEVVANYGGALPDTLEELLKIKGIGSYTAGAILSFAFHKKAAALDANVMRVLARYTLFQEEVTRGRGKLEKRLLDLLPEEEPHIVMEGLIELGALICQKEPKCSICPIASNCLALEKGMEGELPLLLKRKETVTLHRLVACIESEGFFLLKKNEKGKIMADLWEFPFVEKGEKSLELFDKLLGVKLTLQRELPLEKQFFTHYKVLLYPNYFLSDKKPVEGYEWVLKKDFLKLPFSSGHFRIARELLKDEK